MKELQPADISLIIEMAWCDKTSFEAIEKEYGLLEKETIDVMRSNLKPSSYRMWRKRVYGRKPKHDAL